MNMVNNEHLLKYDKSEINYSGTLYYLVKDTVSLKKYLVVKGDTTGFQGEINSADGCLYCPLMPENARLLRHRIPWLSPSPIGLRPSAGMGDRLGLATPGHIRAVKDTPFIPVFAQQSVRENARTGRSPQMVLDEAMWGIFEEGWTQNWGADADHLKNTEDLLSFIRAGFTFFTIDPGEHVDNAAQTDPVVVLREKVEALPWDILQSNPVDLIDTYLNKAISLDGVTLQLSETNLLRALAKYGKAIAHTKNMYQYLLSHIGSRTFDLEVSVDETELPTSVEEHYFISSELTRLKISWVSMAPKFVGRFEKGVDYIGDMDVFRAELKKHTAVQHHFGNYKLSLHSGSDKFSIYKLAAEYAKGKIHLKTAGTSYLEALRVIAKVNPGLFKDILQLGINRYSIDSASYHVSAKLEKVPAFAQMEEAHLADLLDHFDARQVLHVTYGSALAQYGKLIKQSLLQNEKDYYEGLRVHFKNHLNPLLAGC